MNRTLFLLAACGSPDGATDGEAPPSAYILPEGELPVPTAALVDVEAALQDGLDTTLTVDASPVESAYDDAMSGSTADCPYVYATTEGSYWFDSCTSGDGTEFDGYVFSYEGSGVYDPDSGLLLDFWYAFGGATVRDPQDHVLEIAGAAVRYQGSTDLYGYEVRVSSTQISGTFAWDGPSAAGTWLEDELDTDFVSVVQSLPALGGATVALSGGFGGFAGGWSVAYDENFVATEVIGSPCEEELSGTVGVRAPDGAWYDVQFQGWDGVEEDYDASECDGCGELFYQGEPMGTVCVNVAGMLAQAVLQ
jgi:hypothetical protein